MHLLSEKRNKTLPPTGIEHRNRHCEQPPLMLHTCQMNMKNVPHSIDICQLAPDPISDANRLHAV